MEKDATTKIRYSNVFVVSQGTISNYDVGGTTDTVFQEINTTGELVSKQATSIKTKVGGLP